MPKDKKVVDEFFLQNLMAADSTISHPIEKTEPEKTGTDNIPVNEKEEEKEAEKEEKPKRKKGQTDYASTFLKIGSLKERKSVYISKEHQEIINKIVNLLGASELTFGTYVDNVLSEHFFTYQDEINSLIEKRPIKLINK